MSRRVERPDLSLADRAWRGYHPRAAVPAVLVAAAASGVLMVGRWELQDLSELADRVGAWVYFVLSAAVWLFLAAAVGYRLVTFTYRVTDRALLVDYGPRHPPEPPLNWADVTGVAHGAGWLGRRLGVGWVKVKAGPRTVTMRGVRRPAEFAWVIREAKAGGSPGINPR